MNIKVMQVFYGADCLPYKDSERQVHYPITSGSFLGASNTVEIRFYLDKIGQDITWVVNGKLPNGKIGHTLLTRSANPDDTGEYYYSFMLNAFYTQYKGDLYLSLAGYNGDEVLFEEIDDTDTYTINGTPTIQTTGVIKLNIAYSTGILDGDVGEDIDLDTILSELANKLDISGGIVVVNYANPTTSIDTNSYSDLQVFFNKYDNKFYINNSGTIELYANPLENDIGIIVKDSITDGVTTLSESELSEALKKFCILLVSPASGVTTTYLKNNRGATNVLYFFEVAPRFATDGGATQITQKGLSINKTTGVINVYDNGVNLYSKVQADNLLDKKVNLGEENFNSVKLNELLTKYGRVFYCKNTYDGYYYRLELTLVGGDTTVSFRIYQLNTRFVYVGAVNANSYASSVLTSTYRYEYINDRDTQTIGGNKTFTTSPQTNEIISGSSADTKLITKKYVLDLTGNIHNGKTLQGQIDDLDTIVNGNAEQEVVGIVEKIPSQASSSNKLADKDWVNSTINSLAAFYITKNAQGDPFATYAELATATKFYSGGQVRVPTRNDYCLVVSDENHDNASCRYIYQGTQWEFQFVVNETPFTSDQIKAINSGITDVLVAQITTNANAIATINGKLPITKDFVIPTTAWQLNELDNYDTFTNTSDYIGYYVIYNSQYEKVTNDNKDDLSIVAGTTVAYTGKFFAELDAGVDFVINDNAMHLYTPTSDSDQLIRDLYGINVSSNGITQKFTFVCNLSDSAPTEVINFTIAQFGGN